MADRPIRELASAASKSPLSRRTTEPETVFVELGEVTKSAQIAREGVSVPVIALNTGALSAVLAGTPRIQAKVVTQSIPAGVAVSPGSTVDIVLAEPERLPVSIIEDVHVEFGDRTIGEVHDTFIRNNEAVRRVIARNPTSLTLSDTDVGIIQQALAGGGIEVTNQPGHTVENAFNTLQAAFTFG